jgi:hypothetical protein
MLAEPAHGNPGWSAVTLTSALGEPLAKTSHDHRVLRDRGWVVEVGERRRRGAIQTFYKLANEVRK